MDLIRSWLWRDGAILKKEDEPADNTASPYRIGDVDASGVQSAFRKQLAESLAPLFNEVVSQSTRHLQQQLIAVAAVLLLLSFSLITISKGSFAGAEYVLRNSATPIAFAVTVYLELVVAARSLFEWRAWSIQTGAAQLSLERAVQSSFANRPSGADGFKDRLEEHAKSSSDRHPDDGPPPDAEELKRRRDRRSSERAQRVAQREVLGAQAAWIESQVGPLRRINAVRVALEAFFPVLFGGVALVVVVVQRLAQLPQFAADSDFFGTARSEKGRRFGRHVVKRACSADLLS